MRRLIIGCSAAALLLGGGALASSTAVQATTPLPSSAPTEVPSIVGAWLLTVEEFPDDPPTLVAFHADGTYQQANADGTTGIGSWEATGPNSFNLTFVEIFPIDDEGSTGMQTIRAAGEVSEDGQTFTAEFSIEFAGEGAPTGEYGPGHVTGTRINVEPMGTPAGSLDDLFIQFEEGTAPAGSEPAGSEPAGSEPAGSEPAAANQRQRASGSEPAASEPAASEPAASEPAASEPAATEPSDSTPSDSVVPTSTD